MIERTGRLYQLVILTFPGLRPHATKRNVLVVLFVGFILGMIVAGVGSVVGTLL
ncbi:hypothetical protein [Halocatena halophila]|uniref:hypothetical protein n=1 Tax=Halocatena halophila TaxID=2814576 RepID=UPI002ED51ABD